MAWNANGLRTKIHEFREFLPRLGVDIALVSETHLKPGHRVGISNYLHYRNDREIGRGGGTAIFIKSNLPHSEIPTPANLQIEATLVQVQTRTGSITIGSLYNPPTKKLEKADLESLINLDRKVIMAGDLNAKHSDWHSQTTNANGRRLKRISDETDFLVSAPQTPTRYPSIENHRPDVLDITIFKGLNISTEIRVLDELSSDHLPINFSWGRGQDPNHFYLKRHRTDWKEFTNLLVDYQLPEHACLEEKVTSLETSIQQAHRTTTTTKTVLQKTNELPPSITNLIQERRRAIKTHKRTLCPRDKTTLNTLTHRLRTALDDLNNDLWQQKLEGLNTEDGSLWALSRNLRRRRAQMGALSNGHQTAITDQEKAELLASSLDEVADSALVNQEIHHTIIEELETYSEKEVRDLAPVTTEEIQGYISALAKRKAPGPDGITNIMAKSLPNSAVQALTTIVNGMLEQQTFPAPWKRAKVIVIHKPGKPKANPDNYRPISLLSTLGKIAERVVLNRLQEEIKDLELLPPEQFGFREGHGTELQLLRLVEEIHEAIDRRDVAAGIFLDVKRAFDKVWHQGLIVKLYRQNINPGLVKIIANFLTGREFQVSVGDSLSEPRPLRAGVPQGSVLSPTLYNLYTADIPKENNVSLYVYADDVALIATCRSERMATIRLQRALNATQEYFSAWKLSIHPEKSQHITFTNKRPKNCVLKINEQIIPRVRSVKYLGVHIDCRLNWSTHITYAAKKGNIAFAMLYSLLRRNSRLSSNNKLLIYRQMLRPILTYGSLVWGTAAASHLKRLQVVQNKCLRTAVNAPFRYNMSRLHEELGIPKLQTFIHKLSTKKLQSAGNHQNTLVTQALRYTPERRPHRNRPKTNLLPPPVP